MKGDLQGEEEEAAHEEKEEEDHPAGQMLCKERS